MKTEDTIRAIKQELRANMNGVASQRMREAGWQYHVNFGIELPRLQAIAREFEPDHKVAQQLWHENVRESKILATMLMPVERFYPELADVWAEQIPNAEIAQLAAMFLFARLPYAADKAFEWLASERELLQLCGVLTLTRLLMQGTVFSERSRQEIVDQARSLQGTTNLHLRKAVQNILERIQTE
jgi:hypothetical protein